MRFLDVTELRQVTDGVFAWDVPDGWQQGRGAWGGLVAGGVARAVLRSEPDGERQLRTLSLHLPGPLTVGRATLRAAPLRVGAGMSTWSVTIEDAGGGTCAHAVAITGRRRAADVAEVAGSWSTLAPPALPPWREVQRVLPRGPGWPTFVQHLELLVTDGPPLSGGSARCAGYVRFVDQGAWDALQMLSIVDAWYPTALTAVETLRPLATVTYAAHLLVDPGTVPAGEPLAYEASMSAAHEGFTTEIRRLWTLDGRLAVENHQSIVVIR